jgi:hypothetical protein
VAVGSALFVAAPSHQRHGPAAGLHAGLVAPLAHSLRAAMRPRLRAGRPLLGRCYVPGHRDERHAERRHDDNCEQQTGHHVPPQMAARPKSYMRKQASAKFKRRAGHAVFRLWASLGARLDFGQRRSDLISAEMSHPIGFRLEAVARSAHAALRCNITISQNRGDASAREPRTYHGRGFSLLDDRFPPVRIGRSRPRLGANRPGTDLAKQA